MTNKSGRNDPCHCGSGRKYKKCHLEQDEAAARPAPAAVANLLPRRQGLVDVEAMDWRPEPEVLDDAWLHDDDLDDDALDDLDLDLDDDDLSGEGAPKETREEREARWAAERLTRRAQRLAADGDLVATEAIGMEQLERFPQLATEWASTFNELFLRMDGAPALALLTRVEARLDALAGTQTEHMLEWRRYHRTDLEERAAPLLKDVPDGAWLSVRISLEDVEPLIWRRVHVPARFPLGDLHHVIQAAMGWHDSHLHRFEVERVRYAAPKRARHGLPAVEDEFRAPLTQLRSRQFIYEYDMGDSWIHKVFLESLVPPPAAGHPVCVDGAGACPPEDCGGPWAYQEMLDELRLPEDQRGEDVKGLTPEAFSAVEATARLKAGFERPDTQKKSPNKKPVSGRKRH